MVYSSRFTIPVFVLFCLTLIQSSVFYCRSNGSYFFSVLALSPRVDNRYVPGFSKFGSSVSFSEQNSSSGYTFDSTVISNVNSAPSARDQMNTVSIEFSKGNSTPSSVSLSSLPSNSLEANIVLLVPTAASIQTTKPAVNTVGHIAKSPQGSQVKSPRLVSHPKPMELHSSPTTSVSLSQPNKVKNQTTTSQSSFKKPSGSKVYYYDWNDSVSQYSIIVSCLDYSQMCSAILKVIKGPHGHKILHNGYPGGLGHKYWSFYLSLTYSLVLNRRFYSRIDSMS